MWFRRDLGGYASDLTSERMFDNVDYMAGCVVTDNPRASSRTWFEQGRDFGAAVDAVDVSSWNAADVDAGLIEIRSVQRRLDGLVARIGQRANALSAAGTSGSAGEVLRGRGGVAGSQALSLIHI